MEGERPSEYMQGKNLIKEPPVILNKLRIEGNKGN